MTEAKRTGEEVMVLVSDVITRTVLYSKLSPESIDRSGHFESFHAVERIKELERQLNESFQ